MGFRFRKSVRLGPFARLNFSGSGVSLGLGPRGLNVNIGPKGVRQTVGIPGSGLSYQTFSRWSSGAPPAPSQTPSLLPNSEALPNQFPTAPPPNNTGKGFVKWMVVGLIILGIYLIGRKPDVQSIQPVAVVASKSPGLVPPPINVEPPKPAAVTDKINPTAPMAPLTSDEVRDVQVRLKALALDPGPIDGLPGPLTTAAIRKYEAARQRVQTGNLDRYLLEALRRDSGPAIR